MKLKIFALALLGGMTMQLSAQVDQKAKGILDKLSEKTQGYKSISASFKQSMVNETDGVDEHQEGKVVVKGKQYNLTIAGQEVISDGTTLWTLIPDAEEVTVNSVAEVEADESFMSPEKMLRVWEEGFKYKYEKQITENSLKLDVIYLFPNQPDEEDFHTIQLYVDQAKMQLNRAIIKGKDGTDLIFQIKEFVTNKSIPASKFAFDKSKYPNWEVVDMR